MKIREQILRAFNGRNFAWDMSNLDIARTILRPEPSVRRETASMLKAGLLTPAISGWNGQKYYKLAPRAVPVKKTEGCGCRSKP